MKGTLPKLSDAVQVLQTAGFRATTNRVALLALLEKTNAPLCIQDILHLWSGKKPDVTTLYRSLTDLSTAGIVRRIDLNTNTAHYEYTPSRPHHHHVVCTKCGNIEEIEDCSVSTLEQRIINQSTQFAKIITHNLEFFGECNQCLKV